MTGKSTEASQKSQVCPQCGLRFENRKTLSHTIGGDRTPMGELYRRPTLILAVQSQTVPPAAA